MRSREELATVRRLQALGVRVSPVQVLQRLRRHPAIFCDACDAVGVEWRQMNARNISVARRASVARLDRFVGPKR